VRESKVTRGVRWVQPENVHVEVLRKAIHFVPSLALTLGFAWPLAAVAEPEFEGPRLDVAITQEEIEAGEHSRIALRSSGRRVFSTPFNKADGHGDGPIDSANPELPVRWPRRISPTQSFPLADPHS